MRIKKHLPIILLISRCFEIQVRLLALFLAPCSVACEDNSTFSFSRRKARDKSGVSFVLFLAPYSVASEDNSTFSISHFVTLVTNLVSHLPSFLLPIQSQARTARPTSFLFAKLIKTRVLLVLFEDNSTFSFSRRYACDKLCLIYQFCHVW